MWMGQIDKKSTSKVSLVGILSQLSRSRIVKIGCTFVAGARIRKRLAGTFHFTACFLTRKGTLSVEIPHTGKRSGKRLPLSIISGARLGSLSLAHFVSS